MDNHLHHSVHTLNIDSRRNSTSFVDENCGCCCVYRAVVPSSNIRPIDTSAQALAVKRTSGFVRACSELARHREMLASNTDDVSDEQDSPDVSAVIAHKVNTCLMLRLLRPRQTLGYSTREFLNSTAASTQRFCHSTVVVCLSGSTLVSINVVTLHWARLILGWVAVSG